MGWTASSDMRQELGLSFADKDQAIAFCEKHGIAYTVADPKTRKVRPKSYSENFSFYSVRGPGTEPLDRPKR